MFKRENTYWTFGFFVFNTHVAADTSLAVSSQAATATHLRRRCSLCLSHITKVHLLSHSSKSRAENVGIFTKVVHIMWKDSRKSSIKVWTAYEKEAGLPGCFTWVVLLYQPSDTTVFPCWYCSITCIAQAAVLASADYQAVWPEQGSLLCWRERDGMGMLTAKSDFCRKGLSLRTKSRGGKLLNSLHIVS